MDEKCFLTLSQCTLCSQKFETTNGLRNIKSTNLQKSKKSVKDVLNHLAKCIKTELVFEEIAYVCGPCYKKLYEYDLAMVLLLSHQKQLLKLLKTSINSWTSYNKDQILKVDKNETVESLESGNQSVDWFPDDTKTEIDNNDNGDDDNGGDNHVDGDYDSQEDATYLLTDPSSSLFQCTLCNKNLCSKTSLRSHLETHAKRCPICGIIRRDEEYLELHMNIHEGKSENQCRYCPKVYTRRSHVIRHMHMHWNKLKYQCEKCGLRFSQAYMLYNHRMHHEAQEKPLICGICDQVFKSKKTYKHHMVTHQEDRPMHPCHVCGKQFTEKYTLKVHLKTHFEVKNEDGNPIKLHSTLKRKIKEQEYSCIICNTIFCGKETLATHMAEEHDVINS